MRNEAETGRAEWHKTDTGGSLYVPGNIGPFAALRRSLHDAIEDLAVDLSGADPDIVDLAIEALRDRVRIAVEATHRAGV